MLPLPPGMRIAELSPLEAALAERLRGTRDFAELMVSTLAMYHDLMLPNMDARAARLVEENDRLREENMQLRGTFTLALGDLDTARRQLLVTRDHLRRAGQ